MAIARAKNRARANFQWNYIVSGNPIGNGTFLQLYSKIAVIQTWNGYAEKTLCFVFWVEHSKSIIQNILSFLD